MTDVVEIGGTKVGAGQPVYIIGEIGINHNGELENVRKLIDVELWEISIVTFPLLAGARVRAKGSVPPPPISRARARAERAWESVRVAS